MIGLPENIEGPQPTVFLSLGADILSSPPELDRAHHALTAKPGPPERPLPVLICFHRFQTWELVVREAQKLRDKLRYENSPIHTFEDYCPEVLEQHIHYREVMRELYDLGFKPALRYLARLFIATEDGSRKHLSSVGAAKDFITLNRRKDPGITGN